MKLEKIHNPDILTCIANLSSDEVFTPPDIASQIIVSIPILVLYEISIIISKIGYKKLNT